MTVPWGSGLKNITGCHENNETKAAHDSPQETKVRWPQWHVGIENAVVWTFHFKLTLPCAGTEMHCHMCTTWCPSPMTVWLESLPNDSLTVLPPSSLGTLGSTLASTPVVAGAEETVQGWAPSCYVFRWLHVTLTCLQATAVILVAQIRKLRPIENRSAGERLREHLNPRSCRGCHLGIHWWIHYVGKMEKGNWKKNVGKSNGKEQNWFL